MYLLWRRTEKHIISARLLASDHFCVIYNSFISKRQSGISSKRSQSIKSQGAEPCKVGGVVSSPLPALSLNLRKCRRHFFKPSSLSYNSLKHVLAPRACGDDEVLFGGGGDLLAHHHFHFPFPVPGRVGFTASQSTRGFSLRNEW